MGTKSKPEVTFPLSVLSDLVSKIPPSDLVTREGEPVLMTRELDVSLIRHALVEAARGLQDHSAAALCRAALKELE